MPSTMETEFNTQERRFAFGPDGCLRLGGVQIVKDISPPPRRKSERGSFTIVKTDRFLEFYAGLATRCKPYGVLELGIHQGGSYVLFDQLFQPTAISAVDISEPVAPLVDYAEAKAHRHLHFHSSQTDEDLLKSIVVGELHNQLDLVVDDASHDYRLTKTSFDILFPLLRPGGYYIIEDWAWSHSPEWQTAVGPQWKPALTNLVFELIVLLGSASTISHINVTRDLVEIQKASHSAVARVGWGKMRLRDREMTLI